MEPAFFQVVSTLHFKVANPNDLAVRALTGCVLYCIGTVLPGL